MLCLRESRKLASDGPYVHAGYAKRRKPLLQAGITLYEMRRRGRDLHTVSAGSVFDRELELGRLAALRGGGKLGPVAARIEQGGYTRDKPQVVTQRRSEL